jgi:hypothetical protein
VHFYEFCKSCIEEEVRGEWRNLRNEELKRSVLLTPYFAGDKIEKNDMGRACSMDGGGERHVQGFGGET